MTGRDLHRLILAAVLVGVVAMSRRIDTASVVVLSLVVMEVEVPGR